VDLGISIFGPSMPVQDVQVTDLIWARDKELSQQSGALSAYCNLEYSGGLGKLDWYGDSENLELAF